MLPKEALAAYLDGASSVLRRRTGAGKYISPREELCYTTDGRPYTYSGVSRPTTTFPAYITERLLPFMTGAMIDDLDVAVRVDTAVDIAYPAPPHPSIPMGGSIQRHSDNEKAWDDVGVFTAYRHGSGSEAMVHRVMRFRRLDGGRMTIPQPLPPGVVLVNTRRYGYLEVSLSHNQLIVMRGTDFQRLFTHEVPKLPKTVRLAPARYSLNVRFFRHGTRAASTSAPGVQRRNKKRLREEIVRPPSVGENGGPKGDP